MKVYNVVRKKCFNTCSLKKGKGSNRRVFIREDKKHAYNVMDKIEKLAW